LSEAKGIVFLRKCSHASACVTPVNRIGPATMPLLDVRLDGHLMERELELLADREPAPSLLKSASPSRTNDKNFCLRSSSAAAVTSLPRRLTPTD
jgi:hypothetical protein